MGSIKQASSSLSTTTTGSDSYSTSTPLPSMARFKTGGNNKLPLAPTLLIDYAQSKGFSKSLIERAFTKYNPFAFDTEEQFVDKLRFIQSKDAAAATAATASSSKPPVSSIIEGKKKNSAQPDFSPSVQEPLCKKINLNKSGDKYTPRQLTPLTVASSCDYDIETIDDKDDSVILISDSSFSSSSSSSSQQDTPEKAKSSSSSIVHPKVEPPVEKKLNEQTTTVYINLDTPEVRRQVVENHRARNVKDSSSGQLNRRDSESKIEITKQSAKEIVNEKHSVKSDVAASQQQENSNLRRLAKEINSLQKSEIKLLMSYSSVPFESVSVVTSSKAADALQPPPMSVQEKKVFKKPSPKEKQHQQQSLVSAQSTTTTTTSTVVKAHLSPVNPQKKQQPVTTTTTTTTVNNTGDSVGSKKKVTSFSLDVLLKQMKSDSMINVGGGGGGNTFKIPVKHPPPTSSIATSSTTTTKITNPTTLPQQASSIPPLMPPPPPPPPPPPNSTTNNQASKENKPKPLMPSPIPPVVQQQPPPPPPKKRPQPLMAPPTDKDSAPIITNNSRTTINSNSSVSSAGSPRFIAIDGSNVAREHGKSMGLKAFSCTGLKIVVDYFLKRGHTQVKAVVPRFRRGKSDQNCPTLRPELLDELENAGHLTYTPSRYIEGQGLVVPYDDRFIIEIATHYNAVIVSNDNYRDLQQEDSKWKHFIQRNLLQFTFVGDLFIIPSDPFGRKGPSIDEFLSCSVAATKPLPPPPPPSAPSTTSSEQTSHVSRVRSFKEHNNPGGKEVRRRPFSENRRPYNNGHNNGGSRPPPPPHGRR